MRGDVAATLWVDPAVLVQPQPPGHDVGSDFCLRLSSATRPQSRPTTASD